MELLNQERIEQGIIDEAAEIVAREEKLRDKVHEEISRRIDKIFASVAEEQITNIVTVSVQDAFTRTYKRVDTFGNPVGESTSIQNELDKLVSAYWEQKVDNNGRPVTDSWGKKMTRAEWMMLQVTGEKFLDSMKQIMVNTTAQLKEGLREQLRNWVDQNLADLFHVRTEVDKKEGRAK